MIRSYQLTYMHVQIGWSSIHAASQNDNEEIVDILIKAGAIVDIKNQVITLQI